MPSTSGAAAMTKEQREGPWRDLSARLAAVPWPRKVVCPQSAAGDKQESGSVKQEPGSVKREHGGVKDEEQT